MIPDKPKDKNSNSGDEVMLGAGIGVYDSFTKNKFLKRPEE